jgi:L-cysteine S-thiosulfotransferase
MKAAPMGAAVAALASMTMLSLSMTVLSASSRAADLAVYTVRGDKVVAPLAGLTGDAARGRRVALNRETGNCLICHQLPEAQELFQGNVGPSLVGVGGRLDEGQLRLRMIDQTIINPATLMPPYYRVAKLQRVGAKYRDQPVLAAQDIEDVVAYLLTLKP